MTVNAAMPYNTRRKSLSLPSLGIHVPVSHGQRASLACSTSTSRSYSSSSHSLSNSTMSSAAAKLLAKRLPDSTLTLAQPSKKAKRSHCSGPSPTTAAFDPPNLSEHTPPPSPRRRSASTASTASNNVPKTIHLDTVNDDIVEAVIVQLQATGNRPHLVKELAAVLMQRLRIVQQSANPAAIISSRLAAYLKRPCWTVLEPCPIAKELETVHPRRTYFYLTTCPAHPFVADTDVKLMPPPRPLLLITPSVSDEGEDDVISRRQLSPSPEVDLSSPDFVDNLSQPGTPVGSLPLPPGHMQSHGRGARAPSPALEKDEREFTQTVAGLQKRKLNGTLLEPVAVDVEDPTRDEVMLFDEPRYLAASQQTLCIPFATSPAIRPSLHRKETEAEVEAWAHLDGMLEWDKSPESIEVEELDGIFDQF